MPAEGEPAFHYNRPMKLLVFSDIHNDMDALAALMDSDADYYIAAGDTVSWARGLDEAGRVWHARAQSLGPAGEP